MNYVQILLRLSQYVEYLVYAFPWAGEGSAFKFQRHDQYNRIIVMQKALSAYPSLTSMIGGCKGNGP